MLSRLMRDIIKIKNIIENIFGLKVRLKSHDPFLVRSVPNYRYLPIINYIFLTGPLNIIEVGAHEGNFIKNILKKVKNKNLNIFAFEPNPDAQKILKQVVGLDGRVKHFQYGLGAKDEELILYRTRRSDLSSLNRPNNKYHSQKGDEYDNEKVLEIEDKISVNIKTGDEFIRQNGISSVEVLSLNTQGTELDVLNGLKESFADEKIKSIIIEVDFSSRYETNYSFLEVETFMQANNFVLFDINLIKNLKPVGIRMLDLFYVHKSKAPNR